MKSNITRPIEIDGKNYKLDHIALRGAFNKYAEKHNMKKGELKTHLAEVCNVTESSIGAYIYGRNGAPKETVEQMAKALEIDDLLTILSDYDEKTDKGKLNKDQIYSFKRVQDEVLDFVTRYGNTGGYYNYYHTMSLEVGKEKAKEKLRKELENEVYNISVTLNKEWIFLRSSSLYEELDCLINDVLYEIARIDRYKENMDNEEIASADCLKVLLILDKMVEKYC